VVATPRGSVPELVDDGATGFVRAGIDELAAALIEATALDRTVCRARAQARFTDARMARDYLDLFADVLTADVLTTDRPIRQTA
jgi:glycosyltransferase involved in cell wall biosynthesis